MTPAERNVAGLRCSQVLERLSEYVDGELTAAEAERVEAHVRGCDWCERFGGDFSALIVELRRRLGAPEALDEGVRGRLRERLAAGR